MCVDKRDNKQDCQAMLSVMLHYATAHARDVSQQLAMCWRAPADLAGHRYVQASA